MPQTTSWRSGRLSARKPERKASPRRLWIRLAALASFAAALCANAANDETPEPDAHPPDDHPKDQLRDEVKTDYILFFSDDIQTLIPLGEIYPGAPIDGIPALTRPKRIPAAEADYLNENSPVLGVEIDGDARAYPINILNWHEIVNDYFGNLPVSVTYCPLCGTGIAFDARVQGRAVRFGVSGLLHNSDLLMYNRGVGQPSLWQQALGKAVAGPLAGTQLKLLPVTRSAWGDWKAKHPQTTVLSLETAYERDYSRNPYEDYEADDALYFPVNGARKDLPAKEWVFGVLLNVNENITARAYPIQSLRGMRLVHDQIDGENLLLTVGEGAFPAVRAYRRGEYRFQMKDGQLIDVDGQVWQANETSLASPNGAELERIGSAFAAYWFAWSAFYPHTGIHNRETP